MSTAAAESPVSPVLDHFVEHTERTTRSNNTKYKPHYRVPDDDVFHSSHQNYVPDSDSLNDDAFSFSEDDLIPSQSDWPLGRSTSDRSDHFDDDLQRPALTSDTFRKPKDSDRDSRITVSRALLISERQQQHEQDETSAQFGGSATPSPSRPKGLTRTLTSLGRKAKSARNASRSPEKQQKAETASTELQKALLNNATKSGMAHDSERPPTGDKRRSIQSEPENTKKGDRTPREGLSRSRSLLGRRQRKSSFGSYLKFSGSSSPPTAASPTVRPSSPSQKEPSPLQKSFSNHHLPRLNTSDRGRPAVPPLPSTLHGESPRTRSRSPAQRKKDDLWGVFRTLDGDFQK